jgi:hypothetical protein
MKTLQVVLTVTAALVLVSCQSGSNVRATVHPSPVIEQVASSTIYYQFDENFLMHFGPEGIRALERTLQEAHPDHHIQICTPRPDE